MQYSSDGEISNFVGLDRFPRTLKFSRHYPSPGPANDFIDRAAEWNGRLAGDRCKTSPLSKLIRFPGGITAANVFRLSTGLHAPIHAAVIGVYIHPNIRSTRSALTNSERAAYFHSRPSRILRCSLKPIMCALVVRARNAWATRCIAFRVRCRMSCVRFHR